MNSTHFPLFKNDGYSILSINKDQRAAVKNLVSKIKSGQYAFHENPCQCGNPPSNEDVIVSEKDMFGIPNRNILCASCGLIRSEKVINEEQLGTYYDDDYKPINYDLSQSSGKLYYERQMSRGEKFYQLAAKYAKPLKGQRVYDMGCGAGGVMHYFNEEGLLCFGNDYSEEFLAYGRKKNMNIYYGDLDDSKIENDSVDFFILSHVYEHLIGPREYLKRIFSKIKVGGVFIMEVPGVFAGISSSTGYPSASCQFAHVINFYHDAYLRAMFESYGLKVLFGNEQCTFLVEKTEQTTFEKPFVYIDAQKAEAVAEHLVKTNRDYISLTNKIYVKRLVSKLIKGKVF